jgi:hypothetical protein
VHQRRSTVQVDYRCGLAPSRRIWFQRTVVTDPKYLNEEIGIADDLYQIVPTPPYRLSPASSAGLAENIIPPMLSVLVGIFIKKLRDSGINTIHQHTVDAAYRFATDSKRDKEEVSTFNVNLYLTAFT